MGERATVIEYGGDRCVVLRGQYLVNGRPRIDLRDADTGEPVATVTINLPEEPLGEGEVFVNHDCVALGRLGDLFASGLLADTGRRVRSGFVEFVVARLSASPPPGGDCG